MTRIFDHKNPDLLMKAFINEKNGLLAFIQPLIGQIAYLNKLQDPNLSFTGITHEYLEAFTRNASVITAFLDKDFKAIYSSPSWDAWLKKHLSPSLKKLPWEDLKKIPFPKLISPFPHRLKLGLKNNLKGRSVRFDLIDYAVLNKQTRSIYWESFPWYDKNRNLLGIMAFCKDITQRQKIFLANKKLHQCNEMLENFSLIFSHDLIQPIRHAANFLTILQECLPDNVKMQADVAHALGAIEKSLEQVRTISEGVALYCKKGHLTVNQEPVSLQSVIKEVQKSCFDDKKIEINNLIEENIELHANRVCLLQLFQNLLGNAVKHADSDKPTITLSGKRNNNFYEISVHNNGYCSSALKKRNLFKAFESSRMDGAGLGLMICKKIVTAYKGKIGIKSSARKGTTVLFTLPLLPNHSASGNSTVSIQ